MSFDFTLTRRRFIETTAAGILVAPWAQAVKAQDRVDFLVVGDWGRRGLDNQQEVANAMGRSAAARQAAFVISTGDNFYDDGVTSVEDPLWAASFERVYTAPSLQKPWWVVLGNHDYHGDPEAQIAYSARSPRWRMKARYWQETIAGGGASFFFVDTSPFVGKYYAHGSDTKVAGQNAPAQLKWLENALMASQSQWKIVVGHHPVYSGGSKHGDTVELVEAFPRLFKRAGVQAYFCGHEHDLQFIERDGVAYVVSGAGSEVRPTGPTKGSKFAAAEPGFVACSLGASTLTLDYVSATDKTLFSATVQRG